MIKIPSLKISRKTVPLIIIAVLDLVHGWEEWLLGCCRGLRNIIHTTPTLRPNNSPYDWRHSGVHAHTYYTWKSKRSIIHNRLPWTLGRSTTNPNWISDSSTNHHGND